MPAHRLDRLPAPLVALGAMLAAALLLLPGLGATDLWAPDEPRYAQVAEELRSLRHGAAGLVLLHLNDAVYNQKPPLYFWLAALAGAPADRVGEAAARLPSALAGIAAVGLTAAIGVRWLGVLPGALGALLLVTSWEFLWRARRAQLDVLLTLCELAALAAFGALERGTPRRRAALAGLHLALGLAVLTKGPVGWLVPVLGIGAYLAWEGRLRELPRLAPAWALALSLGPGLVWLAAAGWLAPPGYLDEAVVQNLVTRFLEGPSHARPLGYYGVRLPIAFLPWTLLAPWVVLHARRRVFGPSGDAERARHWRLLLAWCGAAFVFFSLAAGKRALYLLPIFPALALLTADAAVATWGRSRAALPRALAVVGGVALVEAAIVLGALPRLEAHKSPRPVAEAAAALAPPGQPVGLLAKRTLVGGLVYYGGRPVRVLEDVPAATRFVAEGGRSLVVDAARLDPLREALRLRVHGRFRRGDRALAVVGPAR